MTTPAMTITTPTDCDIVITRDFNAPRRSLAFTELPAGYQHAFDSVGFGYGNTWPMPVPMYALDQCIFGPRVVPADYRLVSSAHSDHRLQVFDFSLRD